MNPTSGSLAALLRAYVQRAAARRKVARSDIAAALTERRNVDLRPVSGPLRTPIAPASPNVLPAAPGPARPAVQRAVQAESLEERSGVKGEIRLVRDLFGNPQTLVAALIAGEILAPPIALRER